MDKLDYLERIAVALERIANVIDKFDETTIKVKNNLPKIDDSVKHTDAWVMQPYDVCITTYPPQYRTTIYHYTDPNGLCEWALNRGPNTKVFYTKEEAITYCKISLGSEYEIVDIPAPQTVFSDDYE